jgi:hypothetical protein
MPPWSSVNPRRPSPTSRASQPGARPDPRGAVPRPSPPSDPVRQSHHRRPDAGNHLASFLGVTALAVAVLLVFVFVRMRRDDPAPPATAVAIGVGGCVAEPGPDLLQPVGCDAAGAFAKVSAVVGDQAGAECPAATDTVATSAGRLLCLLNLRAPHPGTAGGGGGIIRPGDCVGNPGTGRTEELVCAGGAYYARVLARVDHSSQCKPPAAEALRLQVATREVACLQPRSQVGTCVGAATVGPPDPVACTDPKAVGRVLARATSAGSCPLGTTGRLTAVYGLPGLRIICLGKPR